MHRAQVLKEIIEKSLDDHKALDVVSVDMNGKSDMAYFMVIASGTSTRHVGALANHLKEAITRSGLSNVNSEGEPINNWILLDNPYVVVHLFHPNERARYNLEKMWQADFSGAELVTAY